MSLSLWAEEPDMLDPVVFVLPDPDSTIKIFYIVDAFLSFLAY